MNDSAIETAGILPILDLIEKHGSWNITNRNWDGDSWVLEKILARVLVDIQVPAFLGLDIKQSFFNTSEVFITVICCRGLAFLYSFSFINSCPRVNCMQPVVSCK